MSAFHKSLERQVSINYWVNCGQSREITYNILKSYETVQKIIVRRPDLLREKPLREKLYGKTLIGFPHPRADGLHLSQVKAMVKADRDGPWNTFKAFCEAIVSLKENAERVQECRLLGRRPQRRDYVRTVTFARDWASRSCASRSAADSLHGDKD
ncbi:unnamed protein product [Pieris macdunnoughi]|uniref:Uncharacterized protein n=1 Tax=Pieris macdunnoughi TaxID=345717 RepID=A0A821RHI3_9NEOP|nr:unnamed protein product [Pieris macdunnoughi]